jgi:DNA-binding MarR family transcriptional regulator
MMSERARGVERERFGGALDRILELVLLLNDDMTRSLTRQGLSVSRATLLWTLRQTGPSPQRVLADALGVTARTITGLVDGLQAAGLVTREPHPGDRRATLVTLTGAGSAIVETRAREQEELGRHLFGSMPAERFDGFVAGLGDVLHTLHSLGLRVPRQDRP